MNDYIALALTKTAVGMDPYIVVGEVIANTEDELVLKKAASPAFIGATSVLTFQQHLIPMAFMDADYMENVTTVLRKEYLAFFSFFQVGDPHPLCVQYKQFWHKDEPEKAEDTTAPEEGSEVTEPYESDESSEPAQPKLELL